MEPREPGNHDIDEGAEFDHSTGTEGVRVFETDACIPIWEKSIPGKRIVLVTRPAGTDVYICRSMTGHGW